MKKFAQIMAITGILVLLITCAIFVAAQREYIVIDKKHIQSVVFCALGLSFLCFVPSKLVVLDEAKKTDEDPKGESSAQMAVILNTAAGLILVGLSLWKYWKS